ncbi:hypothetical protein SNE40_012897 [Patella caerulea]|uniref:Uncharacterized protein n=1 Tax=Patella caerulea TaxID=87958 RepID=A0AAN8PSX1_PATCE
MLALITEKLQKQSLDESATNSTSIKIPISNDDNTIKPVTTAVDSLSVKGKNVWTLSIDTSNHGNNKQDGGKRAERRGSKGIKCISTNQNIVCDTSPSTPNAPPPKKHCRSLSVPPNQGDPYFFGTTLCKPIPVYKEFQALSAKFMAQVPGTKAFTKNFMSSASPVSVDSGHVTSSDFQTPPGSPVPRPASAMSEISHSSSWFDHSPYKFNRFEILQNRSLSCEDRISSRPLGGISSPGPDSLRYSSPPRIHRIPRCKSQPCVLHDRKYGKKRRHDYNRPTLDFTKMTQTAYGQLGISKPIPFSPSILQKRSHRDRDDNDLVMRLVPIASSPLDTDIPFKGLDNFPTSPIDEVSQSEQQQTPTGRGAFQSVAYQEPVDFLADSGLDDCDCHDNQIDEDREVIFPLKDLDMDEIEKH